MFAIVPSPVVHVVVDPDPLTGWATVALAALTFCTLIATIVITVADRRAAQKRLLKELDDAERRMREELGDAERRMREEREYAENVRLRQRELDTVADLVDRIVAIMPYLDVVPNLNADLDSKPGSKSSWETQLRRQEARSEVLSLRRGADVQAARLRNPGGAEQYRTLVRLVNSAAAGVPTELCDRVTADLCHYALFVRLSLQRHLHHELKKLPMYDPSDGPQLLRDKDDPKPWVSEWSEWKEAVKNEPLSPLCDK